MWRIAPWRDEVVLDLGAGTGFHLERFHHQAQQVIAVEPDGRLRLLAMERVARLGLERVSVLAGSAEGGCEWFEGSTEAPRSTLYLYLTEITPHR